MNIYLCGPISLGGSCTSSQIRDYKAKFKIAKLRLKNEHNILSPLDIKLKPPDNKWEDYMRRTIMLLCTSDLIIVLPDHEKSKGACLELLIASLLKIPVKRLSEVI